jgi:hypothetical protein
MYLHVVGPYQQAKGPSQESIKKVFGNNPVWHFDAPGIFEVKETWDALPSDDDQRDYYDDYCEDEDDGYRDEDPTDFQLNDLIDDEITLGWWTSPDGAGGELISLYVPDFQVCASTPSANLTPYQSEYEGYMGNYGNTLDRWYRRAAVVVWPRERALIAEIRAEILSPGLAKPLRARTGLAVPRRDGPETSPAAKSSPARRD